MKALVLCVVLEIVTASSYIGKRDDVLGNTNKTHETDLTNFTTYKTKESESYQEIIQNSTGLPLNHEFNMFENENQNKLIKFLSDTESENNFEVSDKNNPDNSKIITKNLHMNVDGYVSNIDHNTLTTNNKDKASKSNTKQNVVKSSSKTNNSTKTSTENNKKGTIIIEKNYRLNKHKDDEGMKPLSSQSDKSNLSAQENTTKNVIEKYSKIHSNHKTLYSVLPNNNYHIDSQKVILTKDYPDLQKKSPEQENVVINHYKNTLGYHNMHEISQGTGPLEKTKYNNELIYKMVKPDFKDTESDNMLTKYTSTNDQNKKKQYDAPLEFQVEDLSESRLPYYLQKFVGSPLNYNLNVLEKENLNKQINNVAKSKSENNVGVSGKNNQDNSNIFIKNLHMNVGGHVSNIAHNNITKNNKDKASTNVNLIKPSSEINKSTNNSKVINKKRTIIIETTYSLNKNKDDEGMKPLSSQIDKSTFSDKENTTSNFIEKYNTLHGNHKTLYYVLPNNHYPIDSKKVILIKNYPDFIKKSPEVENVVINNYKNTLGYHNMHKISQDRDDLEKTKYNNERTYKTVQQGIKDTDTENILSKHTNDKDQNDVPLHFEVEDLSESRLPYYLQKFVGSPLNYNLHVLKNENLNKLINSVAKSKSENNIGVSGKNNQDNSKIIIKNLHTNVGGHVSNIAHNNITKNSKDKASTNVNLINPSRKKTNLTNNAKEINKKRTIIIETTYSLNKNKDDERMKPLSSQIDKSNLSAKDKTTGNSIEKYNTLNGNHKTLYYVLPNNNYHIDSKKVILTKNYPDFIKKSPEVENILINNYKNTLGYQNMHKIRQDTGDLEKTKYNNERTYKTVKQDIKDTVTENILPKYTNYKDQNKKGQNDVTLELEVEDLSESRLPYYLKKFVVSPLIYNLNVTEKKNLNKLINNVVKSKSDNNIGVSGKNNQDNSKIIIKNLHTNVGGHVSNIAHNNITKHNKDKASTNVNLINPSRKKNNLTNNAKEINKKRTTIIETTYSLNKNKDDERMKPLSSQIDKSNLSAKEKTTGNSIEKYNTLNGNHKTLYYVLPNNNYHIDSKKVILTKNYPDFIKKSPEVENIPINNYKNTLGYQNMHKIRQDTGDLEKTKYNNERTYKTVKHDIKDTVTENILSKHTINKDQNKKGQNDVPLEFEVEDLSESILPYNLQEFIGPGISNNKGKERTSSIMVNSKLQTGKLGDSNNLHIKKDREHEEPLGVENMNENDLHRMTNLQVNRENFLVDSLKPIEIEKTREVVIKETKTITFGNRLEPDKKKHLTHKNKNSSLSAQNVYKSFILKDYDSPIPMKKVIRSDKETSDEFKIRKNNGKSNFIYLTLNNLSSSNNKYKNNIKSTKDQSALLHGRDTALVSENEKAKNNLCINCKQNTNIQRIKHLEDPLKKIQSTVHNTISNKNVSIGGKNIQNENLYWNHNAGTTSYRNKKHRHNKDLTGHRDIKKESIHLMNRRADEEDNTKETSNIMTNKDKVISNILAPESVKSDKKMLPYWLPSDAQDVYEILQQPSKNGAVNYSLDIEMPLKEEIDKIVQLKKEFGNENLEEIITLKVNTVGIGKATNIIDKLIPSLYDVYLKNYITKILITLIQKLSHYESYQQKNDVKNLDLHEIRKANSVLDIFQRVRDVFNTQDDESLHELLVALLHFNKQSDEDFDEEAKVILDSVSRNSIYGVLKYYLVSKPRIDAVRDYIKQQELYPQFVYYKVLEDILLNIRLIIINDLAITPDKHDDNAIHKNKDTMEKLVKILIILNRIVKDLGIPETTQRFIIEESVLDIVRVLANAYIKNYEETVYVLLKKQLQDALYNNIDV